MKQYIFLPNETKNSKRTHSIIAYAENEDKAWTILDSILNGHIIDTYSELTMEEIKEMYFLSAVI